MHPFTVAQARADAEVLAQALIGRIFLFLIFVACGGASVAELTL